jgi:AcrR family transcriptional regulator
VPRWKNALRPTEVLHQLKRTAILKEANQIINRRGFHTTSLDDIAAALQVSKGTLYNYVKDKQEILFELHQMALDIGDEAFALADANGSNGYTKLRIMLHCYLTWLNGAMGGCGGASEVGGLRPSDRKIVLARRDKVDDRLTAYLQEGQKDGTVRPHLDTRLSAFLIMGAVNSVQLWFSPTGRLSAQEITSGVVDQLMMGVAGPVDSGYVEFEVPADKWWDAAARTTKARKATTEPKSIKGSNVTDVVDAPAPRKGRTAAKTVSKAKAAPKPLEEAEAPKLSKRRTAAKASSAPKAPTRRRVKA